MEKKNVAYPGSRLHWQRQKCLSVLHLKDSIQPSQSAELVGTGNKLANDLKMLKWEQSLQVICLLFLNYKLSQALGNASLL